MNTGVLGILGQIPELRRRIFFTLGLLAVYRLGVFVSTPGIDVAKLQAMFTSSKGGSLLGLVNMFSGGALENFSIFTLGIAPYITVSIIVQLLTPTWPYLDQMKKEGPEGRRKLTRITRWVTVLLALFQGYMIAIGLESQGLVVEPGNAFRLSTAITLTAGTAFIMWLGEQITERGLGNGISIIIFAGIVARMPQVFVSTMALARNSLPAMTVLLVLLFSVATIVAIVFVENAQRRVPVQYPKRAVGQQMAQTQTQYLPMKLNMVGVLPPIFASSLLLLPTYAMGFIENDIVDEILSFMVPGGLVYELIFAGLILFIAFFLVTTVFNPDEVSEELKKQGGFIPTVRPGKQTAEYLYGILSRLTFWGGLYIAAICVIPQLLYVKAGVKDFAYVFGGTAILIVVGVTIDTVSQIRSMVIAKNYEMYMGKSIKTRGGVGATMRRRILRR
jgi:preprotein translocase subunit SecY